MINYFGGILAEKRKRDPRRQLTFLILSGVTERGANGPRLVQPVKSKIIQPDRNQIGPSSSLALETSRGEPSGSADPDSSRVYHTVTEESSAQFWDV